MAEQTQQPVEIPVAVEAAAPAPKPKQKEKEKPMTTEEMNRLIKEKQQRTLDEIFKMVGDPRVVLVENNQLYVNDHPIQQDEATQRTVSTLLRSYFEPMPEWIEVGPMLINLRGRKSPVVAVLGSDPTTKHAKIQVRLAMGRSARYFLDMSEAEAHERAFRIEMRRLAVVQAEVVRAQTQEQAKAE